VGSRLVIVDCGVLRFNSLLKLPPERLDQQLVVFFEFCRIESQLSKVSESAFQRIV
jgi:hypothetical protein